MKISGQLAQTPLTSCSRIASAISSLWLRRTYPFASFGKGVSMHYSCDLYRNKARYMVIGDQVVIRRNVWLNIPESVECDDPILVLEKRCCIGPGCVLSAQNLIHIGENCVFGPAVFVTDHNHAFEDITVAIRDQGTTAGGRVRIGKDCWIGYGAVIACSRGTLELGDHCVVAANAVVTHSFPPYSVIAGNPSRVIKHFDSDRQAWVLG